jgi:hypothetical protein
MFTCISIASANPCESPFDSTWKSVLIERSEKLDQDLAAQLRTVKSNELTEDQASLVILKQFEFEYSDDYTMRWPVKKTLSAAQALHLKSSFEADFNLAQITTDDLKQFYANHLRQIYLWLGSAVTKNIAMLELVNAGYSLSSLDKAKQKLAARIVEDTLSTSWLERSVNPNVLRDMLIAKPWTSVNWQAVGLYLTTGATADRQTQLLIERSEQNLKDEQPICCTSKPGCRTCPINSRLRS